MNDTGDYPFKQAAHYTAGRAKTVRLIVVHDMEAPENATTAESVAGYFARSDSRKASAHLCVDSNSVVRCVHDRDTAWAAASANADGLHVEHAGYARQTQAEWLDNYGRQMLERSARAVALWCGAYDIPAVKLSGADLKAGKRGICGHADVSDAYPSTGHTDPGPNFPWDYYLERVRAHLPKPVAAQSAAAPTLAKDPSMIVVYADGRPVSLLADGILTDLKTNAQKDALAAAGVRVVKVTVGNYDLLREVSHLRLAQAAA